VKHTPLSRAVRLAEIQDKLANPKTKAEHRKKLARELGGLRRGNSIKVLAQKAK